MARYSVPQIYYYASLDADPIIVTRVKSFTWNDKSNGQSSFNLTIPIERGVAQVEPALGGYIYLSDRKTIMEIKKFEKECDEDWNLWYSISGSPPQDDDDGVRGAKNNNEFVRYELINGNVLRNVYKKSNNVTVVIPSYDILSSKLYSDSLGGFTEVVQHGYTWGTEVVSQSKQSLQTNLKSALVTVERPINVALSETLTDTVSTMSHTLIETGETITVTQGGATGQGGYMQRVTCPRNWVVSDTTTAVTLNGPRYDFGFQYKDEDDVLTIVSGYKQGSAIIDRRDIVLLTDAQMRSVMSAYLESGSVPEITRYVDGGHSGYECNIKCKGDVQTRYNVDYVVGDTISVDDDRLEVVYTGVVSGVTETIGSSGYEVDIEIDTLGATIEQRVNKWI